MRHVFLSVSIASLALAFGGASSRAETASHAASASQEMVGPETIGGVHTVSHPVAYDDFIAREAKKHGVPERLVHRILMRESRYDPRVFSKHCYGLMQIKYPTAREMGYSGPAKGLFDPYVNMTYAIPYLANAYHIAGGDEDRAVALFAGGYYYAAKKKEMLAALRTADSPPLAPESPPPPAPPQNAMAGLFAFLQNSAVQSPAPQAPQVEPAQPSPVLAYASPPVAYASSAVAPAAPAAQDAQAAPASAAEVAAQQPSAPPAQVAAATPASSDAIQKTAADAQGVDTSTPTGSLPKTAHQKTAHAQKPKMKMAALTGQTTRHESRREAKAHAPSAINDAAIKSQGAEEAAAGSEEARDSKSWSEPAQAAEPLRAEAASAK